MSSDQWGIIGCESDRVSQTVNGVTTNYVLDSALPLTQVLSDGTNTYVYGVDRLAQMNSGIPEYFLTDGLGSVRQLVDSTGAIILAKSYEPYGETISSAGSGVSVYQFTGEARDASGLTYLRARYLDSNVGRFISRDTWAGNYYRPLSLNRWMYGYGNPVKYTDPTGYAPTSDNQGINERDLTWWLSQELSTNANSWYTQRIKTLWETPTNDWKSKQRALDAFTNLVQDRAKWDFKHKILDELGRSIVLFDNNADASGWWYEYSVPGNIHFGFVGRAAGIPGWMLHAGAGKAEITDPSHLERDVFGLKINVSPPFCPEGKAGDLCRAYTCPYLNPAWVFTGFDEPRDYNAVETGIQLYDTYGPNITFSQLIQGLTSSGQSLDHSGGIPDWGWQNPRVGWPYAVGRFNGSREAEYEPIIQSDLN